MTLEEFKIKYTTFPTYIGDGVYVNFDGYHLWLKTQREQGMHEIALEPSVFSKLLEYRHQLYLDYEKVQNNEKE